VGQGAPGAAARIQIRGVSSFNGAEPLIVVDGIPYSNNLVNTGNPFTQEELMVLVLQILTLMILRLSIS
jgi:hypothetical protein